MMGIMGMMNNLLIALVSVTLRAGLYPVWYFCLCGLSGPDILAAFTL